MTERVQVVLGGNQSAAAGYNHHGRNLMLIIGEGDPDGDPSPFNVAMSGSQYHDCLTGNVWRRSPAGWKDVTPVAPPRKVTKRRRKRK